MPNIAILGAGAWGTALAATLAANNHQAVLWFYDETAYRYALKNNSSPFLPQIKLPAELHLTVDLSAALTGAEMVLMATPAQAVTQLFKKLRPLWSPSQIMVNCAKGIDVRSGLLISELAARYLPTALKNYTVLSGPSFAEELAQSRETAVVVAGPAASAKIVQQVMACDYLRPYIATDLIGVEVAGAYKNVIAIAAGMLSGLGKGENLQAALLTRGLREMRRFGRLCGSGRAVFDGLAGVGDLTLTAHSRQSRNFSFGRAIGSGADPADYLQPGKPVVEGFYTVKAIRKRARQADVRLTIIEALYDVLYRRKSPEEIIGHLMRRRLTAETSV